MDLGLQGRTAIVTGGASGIGRETARYLARDGAQLLIADLNGEAVDEAVAELRALGVKAEGLALDVRHYADCERMAALAMEHFTGIDVLVTSAGVTRESFFLQTKPEEWELLLEVNVQGVMNANHAVAPHMVDQGRGSIVNIASEAGKVGEKRMVVYSATKGAVIGFSKAFSVEMGRFGVRVNAVCPGVTKTPMTAGYSEEQMTKAAGFYPLGRLGEPRDVAAMITFLASDQAGWVTGQAISVSGGFGRS